MPNHPQWAYNNPAANSSFTGMDNDPRQISRTPSPTPSEQEALTSGAINWKTLGSRKFWFRKEWLWYYVGFVVIIVLVSLMTIYHTQIVHWLTPVTQFLFKQKLGWLVPIGVLFVISFPPLFGHEIVAVLCGLVWGLWVGFGIVAAGTFLGEVGNFYAFKYCCRSRAEKAEKGALWYACLARVVREGGFKIALIARLSAIPGHFTTALFAASGMNIIVFSIAAILSMPKQFITVYLGVILKQSDSGVEDKKSRIISDVVLAITLLITIAAMWYIMHLMDKAKPQVIYARRKARQAKLGRADPHPYMHQRQDSSDVFNPQHSDSDIPLTSTTHEPRFQQWDQHGKAIGFVPDPNIHSPAPRIHLTSTSAKALEEGTRNPLQHTKDASLASASWDLGVTNTNAPGFTDPPMQRSFSPPMMNPYPSGTHSPNLISGAAPPVRPGSSTYYETDFSRDQAFNPLSNVRITSPR